MSGAARIASDRLAREPHALAPDLFAGRTVLVSGGGSGIDMAIAWLFGRLGSRVAICGRSAERLEKAAADMTAHGIETLWLPTDIRDEEAVERLFEAVIGHFGSLDALVNNAGGQYPQAAADIVPKGWRAVVETNLTGSWLMMQAAATHWIGTGRPGSIVNIVASNERGMPGIIHSSAARAGVINASKTAAVEWALHGVRVNCIAPGLIETPGLDVYPAEARAGFANANPQRRSGDPWEVAQAVAFLSCPAASFVTGTTLVIDGGGALSGELWTHRPSPYDRGTTEQ